MRGAILVAIVTLFSLGQTTLAKDVKPDEGFGSLKVLLPTLPVGKGFLDIDRVDQNFKAHYRVGSKRVVIPFGKEVPFAAGNTGCLKIVNSRYQSKETCGIEIQRKKTTVVRLSAITLDWDLENARVDLGPRLKYQAVLPKSPALYVSQPASKKIFYLLPAGAFEVRFLNVKGFEKVLFSKLLKPGAYAHVKLPIDDRRATVQVNFSDVPRAFKPLENNHVNILHRGPQSKMRLKEIFFPHDNLRNPPYSVRRIRFKSNLYNENQIHSTVRLRTDGQNPVNREFKVFPIDNDVNKEHYEIVINNIAQLVPVMAGKVTEVNVENINVHNFVSSKSGVYQIFQHVPIKGGGSKRVQMITPNKNGFNHTLRRWPTKTSLDLANGFLYEFEFFAVDSFGKEVLEDRKFVDLR